MYKDTIGFLATRLLVCGERKSLRACRTRVQAIVGGERIILIHMTYSVTYNLFSKSTGIVACIILIHMTYSVTYNLASLLV